MLYSPKSPPNGDASGLTRHWLNRSLRRDSLHYLAWYMSILLLVMLLASAAFSLQQVSLPARIHWLLIPAQLALTLGTLLAARHRTSVGEGLYLSLLLASIALLGWYLYDAGGHTNPVISLLLIPLAMSAALLGWQATAIVALAILLLYTLLTQYFIPLEQNGEHSHHFMQLHLIGMWITFALSVLLIVGLVLPLALSMRRQHALIAQQREKMLLDEKLIAMATFAASAAHQLGTPLSTLAVLADDLQAATPAQPEVQQDLILMAQQIQVCKTTLHEMMRKAENLRTNLRTNVSVTELIQRLRQQFNLLHPARSVRLTSATIPAVAIASDETLDQALLNLLDNAARVSPEEPLLSVELHHTKIALRIFDAGPGVPDAIVHQLGEPFVSSRQDGLGLGLFLSHATINRLGGTLQLIAQENGTVTEIWLPVAGTTPA